MTGTSSDFRGVIPGQVVSSGRGKGPLETANASTLEEYTAYYYSMQAEYARRVAIELDLIGDGDEFTTTASCYVCNGPSEFTTDFLYSDGATREGKRIPNWRERVLCSGCGLNTRIRGCIHFLEQNLGCVPDANIYISEQSTPLYRYLALNYPNVVGSEYFGNKIPYGSVDPLTGFRNESVTRLTFPDDYLDFMLSFDVFEHVPDYMAALRECYRCLRPGGKLLFSVPFHKGSASTLIHAKVDQAGNIEHLNEPIYHGDPINPDGCLCFHTFGWDILEQLKKLGFSSAEAHLYWSREYAYLGHEQILLTATK